MTFNDSHCLEHHVLGVQKQDFFSYKQDKIPSFLKDWQSTSLLDNVIVEHEVNRASTRTTTTQMNDHQYESTPRTDPAKTLGRMSYRNHTEGNKRALKIYGERLNTELALGKQNSKNRTTRRIPENLRVGKTRIPPLQGSNGIVYSDDGNAELLLRCRINNHPQEEGAITLGSKENITAVLKEIKIIIHRITNLANLLMRLRTLFYTLEGRSVYN